MKLTANSATEQKANRLQPNASKQTGEIEQLGGPGTGWLLKAGGFGETVRCGLQKLSSVVWVLKLKLLKLRGLRGIIVGGGIPSKPPNSPTSISSSSSGRSRTAEWDRSSRPSCTARKASRSRSRSRRSA